MNNNEKIGMKNHLKEHHKIVLTNLKINLINNS